MILNIPSSEFPGSDPGCPHDLSVDWGEFWPLEVRSVNVEGVFLPSVLEPKELPRSMLVFIRVDVSGNIGWGLDSDGFRDVVVDGCWARRARRLKWMVD